MVLARTLRRRSGWRWPLLGLAAICATMGGGGLGCGEVDLRPAEWSYISPAIFQPYCATGSCHSAAAAVSGLDFSTPDNGYASLTKLWVWIAVPPDAGAPPAGVPCAQVHGTLVCEEMLRPLVTPYDPAGSRVVNMLRAHDAPRMPPDRPLTEPDIRLVEKWVLNGACRSGLSCGAARDASAANGSGADVARDGSSPPGDGGIADAGDAGFGG
jgi:hypothetical protein